MTVKTDPPPQIEVERAESSTYGCLVCSLQLLDSGGRPGAVQHRLVGPIATDVERERAVGSRQPVVFLVLARRRCARIDRERAVRVVLQRLVLRAERIALERV